MTHPVVEVDKKTLPGVPCKLSGGRGVEVGSEGSSPVFPSPTLELEIYKD